MRRNALAYLDTELSALSFEQKIAFIDQVREVLFGHEMDALMASSPIPEPDGAEKPCCPACKSKRVHRYGTRNGRQRFRCASCGRVFAEKRARNLVAASKLDRAVWMRYVNCFADGLSLAKCAANCNVSLRTAHFMRMRLLLVIRENLPAWTVGEGERAVLDETFVPESFKGNRTKCEGFSMPRPAYSHGRSSSKGAALRKGLSRAEQICVMSGTDERGRAFFELAGRGTMDAKRCEAALEGRIGKGAIVTTDDNGAYAPALEKSGATRLVFASKANDGELNDVNALHSAFKEFLARKHGVSTRRLPLYLAEFSWRWNARTSSAKTSAVSAAVVKQVASTVLERTRTGLSRDPYPFFDYWEGDEGRKESQRKRLAARQTKINNDHARAGKDPAAETKLAERQRKLDKAIEAAGIAPEDKDRLVGKSSVRDKRACTTHLLRGQRGLNAGALRKYLS